MVYHPCLSGKTRGIATCILTCTHAKPALLNITFLMFNKKYKSSHAPLCDTSTHYLKCFHVFSFKLYPLRQKCSTWGSRSLVLRVAVEPTLWAWHQLHHLVVMPYLNFGASYLLRMTIDQKTINEVKWIMYEKKKFLVTLVSFLHACPCVYLAHNQY